MNKVERLLHTYNNHISVPWRQGVAAQQRVIFCVYDPAEERRMRANIGEFELATQQANHRWALFDLTPSFAQWLSAQRYAEGHYKSPDKLPTLLRRYPPFIEQEFAAFNEKQQPDENTVVALLGVGSLFGFVKAKQIIDLLSPLIPGRLLVFFPGSYENNNYRLLDGYDGWGYHAIPITAGKQF